METKHVIFQVVDSLSIGGSERMSVNIYNTLTKNKIENYLIVTRNNGPLSRFIENSNNVRFLNKKRALDLVSFFKLFKLIKKMKPSIIHAHQTSIYWVLIIKLVYPKLIVIWHDHWGFSDLLRDSDRKIIRMFSFLIDGVICVNVKIKKWNSAKLKIRDKSIIYIPNYPLLNLIEFKKSGEKTILCVANIRDQKDHPNLLKACSILKNQNVDFKLLLAGSLEDKVWVEKVNNLIIDLNLVECVKILGPVEDISQLLSFSDLGVLSSVSEGLPVSLLEYGLAGLPVVCTDVGQCREVLGDGEFGWLVPPKSPELLAIAIKESLMNQEISKIKAEKLSYNINKNYGSSGFLKKYINFINEFQTITC